jgi:hypothetical protein
MLYGKTKIREEQSYLLIKRLHDCSTRNAMISAMVISYVGSSSLSLELP